MANEMVVLQGKAFTIELQSMLGSTNYGWCLTGLPQGIALLSTETEPAGRGIAATVQRFWFGAVSETAEKAEIEFTLIKLADMSATEQKHIVAVTVVPSDSEEFAPYSENSEVMFDAVRNAAIPYGYVLGDQEALKYGYPCGAQDAALKYGYPCGEQDAAVKYGYPCGAQDAVMNFSVSENPPEPILAYGYPCGDGNGTATALIYGYPCGVRDTAMNFSVSRSAADPSLAYGYPCGGNGTAMGVIYGYPGGKNDNGPILIYGYPNGTQDAAVKYGYPCNQNVAIKYGYACKQDAAVKYGYPCKMQNAGFVYGFKCDPQNPMLKYGYYCDSTQLV